MKGDVVYLRHILECIRRAEENTSPGYGAFMGHTRCRTPCCETSRPCMAESTQRLSDEAKSAHTTVDWRAISGFRNVLVHNYLGIDLEQIWAAIKRDMPVLKAAAEAELRRGEELA
jgi:uncharacterized protein with HEPN domain